MVRIARRDGKPDEELYCADEKDARVLMDDFNDPNNADMYRSISLIRVDWHEHTEQVLDAIEF